MPKKVRGMLVYNNRIIDSLGDDASEIEEKLSSCVSEFGYAKHRFEIEIWWLYFLIRKKIVKLPEEYVKPHNGEEFAADEFLNLVFDFDDKEFERIVKLASQISDEGKIYELFICEKLKEKGMETLTKYIHLGCSDEEMEDTAYALLINDARDFLNDTLYVLCDMLYNKKQELLDNASYANNSYVSAIANVLNTWLKKISASFKELRELNLAIEFSGASKNYSTFEMIQKDGKKLDVDWKEWCREFIERKVGLEFIDVSIYPSFNDSLYQTLNAIRNINNLIKFICKWINHNHKTLYSSKTREDISLSYDFVIQNIDISNALIENTIIRIGDDPRGLGIIGYGNIGLTIGYSIKAINKFVEIILKIDVQNNQSNVR